MTHVLVVDDDGDIRRLLTLAFTRRGWSVSAAGSGQEALAALRDDPTVDAMILDVQMSGMDGWETLRAVRSDPGITDVAVIVSTVKARTDEVQVAWERGCDGFVPKPYNLDRITAEVERVLERPTDERPAYRSRMLDRLTGTS